MAKYYKALQNKLFFTIIAVAISSSILMMPLSDYSFAHNFAPNESAQFLALMQLIQTETELVQSNLDDNNITLANDHTDKAIGMLTPAIFNEITERNERVANELNSSLADLKQSVVSQEQNSDNNEDLSSMISEINAITEEAITVRIDQDQRDNATIQAIAFATIIDEILKNYGDAYAVGFDLTDMSNMGGMGMAMDMGNMNENNTLVNATDYQTAQALAERAQELFSDELQHLTAENNSSTSLSNLETGLAQLSNSINDNASPMDVMMIVHSQVHPNLMTTFNLSLEQ